MLIPNATIWHTRIQNVDALLTAPGLAVSKSIGSRRSVPSGSSRR